LPADAAAADAYIEGRSAFGRVVMLESRKT
jgi:hypothetical protein